MKIKAIGQEICKQYKEMPNVTRTFRAGVDLVYFVNALMSGYMIAIVFGLKVIKEEEVHVAADTVSRILCGIAASVTLIIMVIALNLRVQADSDSWKAEQKVLAAGGAAGVFIIFTIAANEEAETAFGAAGSVFLLLFLASALLLEVPIRWARENEEEEKKNVEDEVVKEITQALKEGTETLREVRDIMANIKNVRPRRRDDADTLGADEIK
ncbi:hypothetical protein ACT3TZ_14540 [Brachybacterium sp. AOP25-B2-12]|uniref:hypothetical protein n=1 Tax=Brachybacterium sp. AOP25-B2-12 TaxID=3457710 RepID=UPI0040332201